MRAIWPTGVWGREEVPASLFAPVPGRDDGSTALGLGNWNTLQGFWRALMAMGSGCPGGDLHPSRAWWTGLGLGFSEALCLARGLFPLLGGPFLGLPLCVPALSAYPVLLGTRLTARLVRDRGVGAISAESKGFGPSASFLLLEAVLLPALRGADLLPLVLERISRLGFHPDFSRFRAGFRLFSLRRGLSWRSAGGVFPWRLSSRFLPFGRVSSRVAGFRQREGELEGMAYCPRMRG